MLEHTAQKRQGICESLEFIAQSSWTPASLHGPMPPLWIFASMTIFDRVECPFSPLAFGI